jgi:hypothetical protein
MNEIDRLGALKEQLERIVELDSDVIKVYKLVKNAKFRSVIGRHMKKTKSFVYVIMKQVNIEAEGKLKPAEDEDFAFILDEIKKQVEEAVEAWETDKGRMGVSSELMS